MQDLKITAPMKIIAKSDLPRPTVYGATQGRKDAKAQGDLSQTEVPSVTQPLS
jgi:hypothetical protein